MLHVDEAVADRLTNDPTTRTVRIDANIDGEDLESSLLENASISVTGGNVESATPGRVNVDGVGDPSDDGETTEKEQSSDEEKTTAPLEQPGDTQIRLKFLDETSKMVGTFLSKTVGDFKR